MTKDREHERGDDDRKPRRAARWVLKTQPGREPIAVCRDGDESAGEAQNRPVVP
jgi:hypothetical protein